MTQQTIGRVRVEKDVVTRIRRSLKGKGNLNVQVDQQVSPDDILGTCTITSGFRVLNLASLLSVKGREVSKYLTRKIGERIYKGELLAAKSGNWLFDGKKIVTAPSDGVLDFLNEESGELKMTFLPKKEELPAGVYGIVEQVDKDKGIVTIRTQVTKIYGVLGSGRFRDGILHILGKRDDLISKSVILPKYNDYILVGGSVFYKDAISECISVGVSGIIAGGINAKDYQGIAGGRIIFPKKLDNDVGVSLVITEGFGSLPIADDIFDILADFEGRFILADGNKSQIFLPSFSSSSLAQVKNTQLPPVGLYLNFNDTNQDQITELKLGSKVRIIGNSYLSEQGKVIAIDESETLLPSGVQTILITVETKRRKIKIPVANCEIIL